MKKVISITLGVLFIVAFLFALKVHATTGPLQGVITYYTKNDGTNFFRSTIPFTSGQETQSANSNGSVTVNITGVTGYADSGFVIYFGKLKDLTPFSLSGTGNYGLNLWFDTNNNGEFFAWDSGGKLLDLGGDTYGLGPSTTSGNLSVSGSSPFFMMTLPNGSPTLDYLKNGLFPGISQDTYVAIWVGVSGDSTKSATISSLTGFPLLNKEQCMKGGWQTFTNPSFKNQGECISYIQSKAVPSATGDALFDTAFGQVHLVFDAHQSDPVKGFLTWTRTTPYANSWSGPVTGLNISGNEALITVSVDSGQIAGCKVTFDMLDNGEPGVGQDSVNITAVTDISSGSCGYVGQIQNLGTVVDGNIQVHN